MSFPRSTPPLLAALLIGLASALPLAAQTTPPVSTFFSTAQEEAFSTVQMTPGAGDLWPSCWASDGNLYAANGDGPGFGSNFQAMVVNRISGTPSEISGAPSTLTGTLLKGDVGTNYTGAGGYTDKPTGMLCVNGAIYLAFQNIDETSDHYNFEYTPAASIVESTDGGNTWTAPSATPMFGTANNTNPNVAAPFTTIMFLDFGQNNANAIDSYVYAYGLDNNWRDQQNLYLARVPANSVLTRSAWQFYTGMNGSTPNWSSDITQKAPVLTDTRLPAANQGTPADGESSYCGTANTNNDQPGPLAFASYPIGQGGIVYDAPLKRYLFSSWSCTTHELYEAPQPWGPWNHIAPSSSTNVGGAQPSTMDFGPWLGTYNRGQYGTSIPSKFISADGHSMWLQSNVCQTSSPNGPCNPNDYTFSLRQVVLGQPSGSASNGGGNGNLGLMPGTVAISKSTEFGSLCGGNCSDQLATGNLASEDDYDNQAKPNSWWGYTWPTPYTFNQVVYKAGSTRPDGGWYASDLRVQTRQNGVWTDISSTPSPTYPYSSAASGNTYTFTFPAISSDGVRIVGTPGGSNEYTAINQLSVTYGATLSGLNLVQDPGFEQQTSGSVSGSWSIEGSDPHGVDRNAGFSHTGVNNGWINITSSNWNAITQVINVAPNTNYTFSASVQNNFTTNTVYCGVRDGNNNVIQPAETDTQAAPQYITKTSTFNSGNNSTLRVYCGFWGNNTDQWTRIDDISVR